MTATTHRRLSSDCEALVLALQLAITAPTEEQCLECTELAEHLAAQLSLEEVEACKALAKHTAHEA